MTADGKRKLFNRVITIYVASCTLLIVILTGTMSIIQFGKMSSDMEVNGKMAAGHLAVISVDPIVQTLAYDRILDAIDGILEHKLHIRNITVYNLTGEIVASGGTKENQQNLSVEQMSRYYNMPEKITMQPDAAGTLEVITVLENKTDVIGIIKIGLSNEIIKKNIIRSVLLLSGSSMMLLSLTIFIFYSLMNRHLGKPLDKITSIMESYGINPDKSIVDEVEALVRSQPDNEIGLMTVTFKNMLIGIESGKQLENSLRNYLSNIIDSMPSQLVGVDSSGNVTQWNRTIEQTTGITADTARGQKLTDLLPWIVPEMNQIASSIRTRQIRQEQKRPRSTENGTCYEDVTIYPLVANGVEGAVIRIDDVTEKVRLEEMMIQSEKMLSVGGLAAGMAHEINNPLAGMMQTAEVMASRLVDSRHIPASSRAAEAAGTTMEAIERFMKARGIPRMIDTINKSGKRVAAIVDNMLSFARKSEATVASHSLEELLDKTLELAATDYDLKKQYDFKRIEIDREYVDNLPAVPCEGAKIQQVMLNILRNGAEAMQKAHTDNPRFVFRTRLEAQRGMVRLEIEDNGPGMDEATRKRVFEPFFTTKPVGIGTGLGLSVSYFIVTESHSGEMMVDSRPGAGAKFVIRLPIKGK